MESGQTAEDGRRSTRIKQHRVTQACDFCHRRSIRCRTTDGDNTCQNCRDYGNQCTYNRKPRRRGTQPRSVEGVSSGRFESRGDASNIPTQQASASIPQRQLSIISLEKEDACLQKAWVAPVIATQAVIVDLVDLYFEIVYPIFPFFHQPSFTRRISRANYTTDKALFAVTMAVCGLVSGRVRDGALNNPRWDLSAIRAIDTDDFIIAAKAQLFHPQIKTDIDTLRAHAILSLASIQNSKIRDMHFHLGMYHTLVATDALHDESNWPRDITIIEKEERRRLFWSMYTLDIFTSVVWGDIVRCREKQSNVAYPTEVDDEFITDNAIVQPSAGQQAIGHATALPDSRISNDCWLSGWNFITDLYRILEHALTRSRGRNSRAREYPSLQEIFPGDPNIAEASVCDSILHQMYLDLPQCFKETPNMTLNTKEDRFAFQAANITGSLQLVRIVLFASSGSTIEARCQIAREVVDAFVSIPATYLLAISTPLLHHLGGIGTVLGSVFEGPGTLAEYRMAQSIILSMAQLLENLEPIHQSSSASQTLRDNAARIDAYIESKGSTISSDMATSTNQSAGFMRHDSEIAEILYEGGVPDTTEGLPMLFQSDLLDQLAWSLNFDQTWD